MTIRTRSFTSFRTTTRTRSFADAQDDRNTGSSPAFRTTSNGFPREIDFPPTAQYNRLWHIFQPIIEKAR
jgi:hypothetical protein